MEQTSKQYFRGLKIIHFALIMGLVAFVGVGSFLVSTSSASKSSTDVELFSVIAPILAVIAFFTSFYLFKFYLKKAKELKTIKEKTTAYSTALIISLALLEAPGLFAVVITLMTSNLMFLIITAVMVAYMLTFHPSQERFIRDLELNREEQAMVMNPDAIISEVPDQK